MVVESLAYGMLLQQVALSKQTEKIGEALVYPRLKPLGKSRMTCRDECLCLFLASTGPELSDQCKTKRFGSSSGCRTNCYGILQRLLKTAVPKPLGHE